MWSNLVNNLFYIRYSSTYAHSKIFIVWMVLTQQCELLIYLVMGIWLSWFFVACWLLYSGQPPTRQRVQVINAKIQIQVFILNCYAKKNFKEVLCISNLCVTLLLPSLSQQIHVVNNIDCGSYLDSRYTWRQCPSSWDRHGRNKHVLLCVVISCS